MKKNLYKFALLCVIGPLSGQVGINTTTPQASLDVNGNMKLRLRQSASSLSGIEILAVDPSSSEIFQINPSLLIASNSTVNSSLYSSRKTAGMNLVSFGIFPSGFRAVNFVNAERIAGQASLFSDTDNTYTVPSTGVYQVYYTFKYGTGLQDGQLPNSPGVGIVRTRAGVSTVINSVVFSNNNGTNTNFTISKESILALHPLQAGDKLSFGVTASSLLDPAIVSASTASFSIFKISD